MKSSFNAQAPIAQKVVDKVVFRRFKGEEVEFFLNRTDPPLRFLMRIFWKIPILALLNLRPLKNFVRISYETI